MTGEINGGDQEASQAGSRFNLTAQPYRARTPGWADSGAWPLDKQPQRPRRGQRPRRRTEISATGFEGSNLLAGLEPFPIELIEPVQISAVAPAGDNDHCAGQQPG